MRVVIGLTLVMMLGVVTPSRAQRRPEAEIPQGPQDRSPEADSGYADLLPYEPTGLSFLRPYRPGKIPVVFIHGLWSSPWSWSRMIEALEADDSLRERYQFWTFGYSTGDPIPYSADLLRQALQEARRRVDPDGKDAAFDRMVLVGHSMGGLLAQMMIQEGGTRFWNALAERPFDQLKGEPEDRDLLRRALFFHPRPEVRRVIFIATPHRGCRFDRGRLQRLGARLVRPPDPLRAAYDRLKAANGPDLFKPPFRDALPTSIDELGWESPMLTALGELSLAPRARYHSIIADRRDPPGIGGGDGVVPYASAHLVGAASELLVTSGHLCQGQPAVLREVRRILAEHARP
jgi:pimeloyl-ACP methyl ester carboxylesterase